MVGSEDKSNPPVYLFIIGKKKKMKDPKDMTINELELEMSEDDKKNLRRTRVLEEYIKKI